MEMQKLFTKKNSKKGPIEELKEQIIWMLNGVWTALSPTHFVGLALQSGWTSLAASRCSVEPWHGSRCADSCGVCSSEEWDD